MPHAPGATVPSCRPRGLPLAHKHPHHRPRNTFLTQRSQVLPVQHFQFSTASTIRCDLILTPQLKRWFREISIRTLAGRPVAADYDYVIILLMPSASQDKFGCYSTHCFGSILLTGVSRSRYDSVHTEEECKVDCRCII